MVMTPDCSVWWWQDEERVYKGILLQRSVVV